MLPPTNPDPDSDSGEEARAASLDLPAPSGENTKGEWSLFAHSKRIMKDWLDWSESHPQTVLWAYKKLTQSPTTPIPSRCFLLRGKANQGCWELEAGSGDRVYYKPFEAEKKVVVFYAGAHPKSPPVPPKGL
jgi:hypothetical protein